MSTYNWNNRVSITVPVGLNGWYYAGTITINGITTKFPVGVETNLPEPVAAMVQKMIEVEEGNKPIKPDNHYTGGVTIPKGKTLTIAKGASIFDENTAPTVILPETVIPLKHGHYVKEIDLPMLPEEDKEYNVTYNGALYTFVGNIANYADSDGIAYQKCRFGKGTTNGSEMPCYVEINYKNGIYTVDILDEAAYEAGLTTVNMGIYHEEEQSEAGGSSSGSAGGGGSSKFVITVAGVIEMPDTNMTLVTPDKTFADTLAAAKAGKDCMFELEAIIGENQHFCRIPLIAYNEENVIFSVATFNGPLGVVFNKEQVIFMQG